MEKLNLTVAEGYPSKNTQTAGLLRDQFVKTPRSSRWYDMQADKKDSDSSTVRSWSPELAKLNNAFSRVARRSLPAAPHSRAFSQDILRRWERAASLLCVTRLQGCHVVSPKYRTRCSRNSRTYTLSKARASPQKEHSKLWTSWNIY